MRLPLQRAFAFLGLLVVLQTMHPTEARAADYLLRPGDLLLVSVWHEADLAAEVLIRPDGKFSFPLAGEIKAAGRTPDDVRMELVTKIESYIPDAVVTVMVKDIGGNKAFVVGKVLRPGPIPMTEETNVMQALSMAGGTAQFASLKSIKVLRGQGDSQTAINFNYDQVESGKSLEQNIALQPGDVVVVP